MQDSTKHALVLVPVMALTFGIVVGLFVGMILFSARENNPELTPPKKEAYVPAYQAEICTDREFGVYQLNQEAPTGSRHRLYVIADYVNQVEYIVFETHKGLVVIDKRPIQTPKEAACPTVRKKTRYLSL